MKHDINQVVQRSFSNESDKIQLNGETNKTVRKREEGRMISEEDFRSIGTRGEE